MNLNILVYLESFQMAKIHVRTLTPPGPPGKAANRDHY